LGFFFFLKKKKKKCIIFRNQSNGLDLLLFLQDYVKKNNNGNDTNNDTSNDKGNGLNRKLKIREKEKEAKKQNKILPSLTSIEKFGEEMALKTYLLTSETPVISNQNLISRSSEIRTLPIPFNTWKTQCNLKDIEFDRLEHFRKIYLEFVSVFYDFMELFLYFVAASNSSNPESLKILNTIDIMDYHVLEKLVRLFRDGIIDPVGLLKYFILFFPS
jgi:hypothetical protein